MGLDLKFLEEIAKAASRLKKEHIIAIVIFFIGVVLTGITPLFAYHREIIEKYDLIKILLISSAISTPFVIVNWMATELFPKELDVPTGDVPEDDTSDLIKKLSLGFIFTYFIFVITIIIRNFAPSWAVPYPLNTKTGFSGFIKDLLFLEIGFYTFLLVKKLNHCASRKKKFIFWAILSAVAATGVISLICNNLNHPSKKGDLPSPHNQKIDYRFV